MKLKKIYGQIHYLKTWEEYYIATENGSKSFEYRINDRDFQVGDKIILQEYNPETKIYTGRQLVMIITYILQGGTLGVPQGYAILGIKFL